MPAEAQIIGPLRVVVDAERARAYGRETGFTGAGVPFAFPAVWLTEPALRDPVAEICAAEDAVPVHESQSFSYAAPLNAGESYDLVVALRREETPPRIILDAAVKTPAGETLATIEAKLRVVPRALLKGAA